MISFSSNADDDICVIKISLGVIYIDTFYFIN
jgi:hypothetical protein